MIDKWIKEFNDNIEDGISQAKENWEWLLKYVKVTNGLNIVRWVSSIYVCVQVHTCIRIYAKDQEWRYSSIELVLLLFFFSYYSGKVKQLTQLLWDREEDPAVEIWAKWAVHVSGQRIKRDFETEKQLGLELSG